LQKNVHEENMSPVELPTTYTYDREGNDLIKTPQGDTTYTYDGNANLASYADSSGTGHLHLRPRQPRTIAHRR
jgi:YD repeat-containing protein